jgi:predicted chitinase
MKLYEGCVENRDDPLKLGRCQVRVVGLHTHDKNILPTADLPWAYPLQSVTSAAISGLGHSPVGLVEGTWVVIMFRDEDEQQPVILGSIGGIPQNKSTVFDIDDTSAILKNPVNDNLETTPTADDETPQVVQEAPKPAEVKPNDSACSQLASIPTTAPSDITRNKPQVEANIKLIIDACCKANFTKEQTCAMLGIVGGECGFIPKDEGFEYKDPTYLMKTFRSAFNGNLELATQYSKWKSQNKGTAAEFFEFVYGNGNRKGKELGNNSPGDGGKYFGRGFIQLTGKGNYNVYKGKTGVDIISNPEILNTDAAQSVKIAVLYFQDRVGKASPTAHPGYFYAAKDAINKYDNPEKKEKYYQYFYGKETASSIPESDATAPPATPAVITENERVVPAPSSDVLLGFKDPNDKYPLKDKLFEQDTNRLARGVSKGTIVPKKESQRARNILKALRQGSFDEPTPPYSAKYPFNHVFESESGHVQEFDDTPGRERTQWYHRKGTFTEVDHNGTEVHHIVGDSYHIIDRNGCLYVRGECNITVDGDTNILCRSDANIEVAGDANMEVGGNYNLGVAENMNVAIGGNLSMFAQGTMNFNSVGQMNQVSSADIRLKSSGELHLQASKFHGDAGRIDFNNGTSSSAASVTLTPPAVGQPIYTVFEYLIATNEDDDEINKYETEEEWANAPPEVRNKMEEKYGGPVETIEEAQATGGTNQTVPASCEIIFNTQDFTSDFRLSQNFTLGMLFDGGFNKDHKLVNQNGLTKQQIVCNLSQLCQNILEPYLTILPNGIRGYNKEWRITSGYRQGTSNSQHNKGQACDISLSHSTPNRKQTTYELVQQLEKIVPYDQLILEYRGANQNWIHTSYNPERRRKQAFTMVNDKKISNGFVLL